MVGSVLFFTATVLSIENITHIYRTSNVNSLVGKGRQKERNEKGWKASDMACLKLLIHHTRTGYTLLT
jgi:hypothetical protein